MFQGAYSSNLRLEVFEREIMLFCTEGKELQKMVTQFCLESVYFGKRNNILVHSTVHTLAADNFALHTKWR